MSEEILKFAAQYSLCSGYIIFTFGVIGNTLNILVFTQLKLFRDNQCAFCLTVESISNFIFQFLYISLTILPSIYGDDATGRSVGWCRFRYILGQVTALTTFYMPCFSAAGQFFSTNPRFYLRQMCTLKLTQYLTYPLLSIWLIHSILFGVFLDVQPSFGCVIWNYTWLQYSTFFIYPVLTGFLPVVIASSFSILAFRNVRQIVRRQLPIVRRRLDQQMTAMVLMRVAFFVCSVVPYIIDRIYVINFPLSPSESMEYAVGRLFGAICGSFASLNFSANFYIFMISSARFRRQVKHVLVKKCWQRWTAWCCFNKNQVRPENAPSPEANIELE